MRYTFICKDCGKNFEKEFSVSQYKERSKSLACTKCGSKEVQRVYQAPRLGVKGNDNPFSTDKSSSACSSCNSGSCIGCGM